MLKRLLGWECLTRLLAYGALQQDVAEDVTNYLVILPMGQQVLDWRRRGLRAGVHCLP